MRLLPSILALSLSLTGAGGKKFDVGLNVATHDPGMIIEPRANSKMPSYDEVVRAALKKYPTMQESGSGKSFNYKLKACDETCSKKQVKDSNGKCANCPKGTEPNKGQTKCVPSEPDSPEDKKGKCPDGQILDPAAGGQDSKTEKPQCIPDDDDARCPEDQKAASRPKNKKVDDSTYEPKCAIDENPDFTCDDPNTYDYKTVKGGKIEHRCRSTRKYDQDKKNKYNERVNTAKNDGMDPEERDRNKRKQGRTGYCLLAMAGIGAFNGIAEEVKKLSDDEIDGMYAVFPEDIPDPEGDGTIPNYMVEYRPLLAVAPAEQGTAGLGGLFAAIIRAIVKVVKGAPAAGVNGAYAIKRIGSGLRRGPTKSTGKAASQSSTVGKIFKNEKFLDCLASAIETGTSIISERDSISPRGIYIKGYEFVVDPSLTPEQSRPAPKTDKPITIGYGVEEDDYDYSWAQTFHSDDYYRQHRIPYEVCFPPVTWVNMDNKIVSLSVYGGCCSFYDGSNCEGNTHMFDMENREHGDIQGAHRAAISSIWCTFEANCAGAPKP